MKYITEKMNCKFLGIENHLVHDAVLAENQMDYLQTKVVLLGNKLK